MLCVDAGRGASSHTPDSQLHTHRSWAACDAVLSLLCDTCLTNSDMGEEGWVDARLSQFTSLIATDTAQELGQEKEKEKEKEQEKDGEPAESEREGAGTRTSKRASDQSSQPSGKKAKFWGWGGGFFN